MINRFNPGPRMSAAVTHGNTVYFSGQVADDTSADAKGQTEQILATIDKLLAEVGSDKTSILSATIYLADIKSFGEMNAAWDSWVVAGQAPARATVEARLALPEYTVEISIIAALP